MSGRMKVLRGTPWSRRVAIAFILSRGLPSDLTDCAPARPTSQDTQILHPTSMALVISPALFRILSSGSHPLRASSQPPDTIEDFPK